MASRRRKFTPQFKARVVLEVLTGAKRPAQACREYGISESVLSRWRKTFLEGASQAFVQGEAHNRCEERIAELERLVGRLTMELEIAKKASLLLDSPREGNGGWR
jgi:transposase-like protein